MSYKTRPSAADVSAAHFIVGAAGSAALHAIFKPTTDFGKVLAWIVGAAVAVWLHVKLDAPVAKAIAALT